MIEKYLEGVLISLIFLKKTTFLKKKGDIFISFLGLDNIIKELRYPTLFSKYIRFRIFLLYFIMTDLRLETDNKFRWFIKKE